MTFNPFAPTILTPVTAPLSFNSGFAPPVEEEEEPVVEDPVEPVEEEEVPPFVHQTPILDQAITSSAPPIPP